MCGIQAEVIDAYRAQVSFLSMDLSMDLGTK